MNLLVAHGGGPTAVINSSLQGVIERARELDRHGKIYAARFGLEGILRNDLADLTDVPASAVNRLRGTPSSALGLPQAIGEGRSASTSGVPSTASDRLLSVQRRQRFYGHL